MKFSFPKVAFALSVLLVGVSGAAAQEGAAADGAVVEGALGAAVDGASVATIAPVPPTVAPLVQPVLSQCALQDPQGTCIGSSSVYLTSLSAANLAAVDYSQNLSDFVIALTALAQSDTECNVADDEVSQAIRLAASQALDEAQRQQFIQIADTISSCSDFQTAAIDAASPA